MRFQPGDDVYTVMDTLGRIVFATPDFEEACAHADRMTGGAWQLLAPTPEESVEASEGLRRAANPKAKFSTFQRPARLGVPLPRHADSADGPEKAMRDAGLRPISVEEVAAYTVEQAYAEVLPILHEQAEAKRRLVEYRPFNAFSVCRRLGIPATKPKKNVPLTPNTASRALIDRAMAEGRVTAHDVRRAIKADVERRKAAIKIPTASELTKPLVGLLTENAKLSKATKDRRGRPTVALGLTFVPEHTAFRGKTASRPTVSIKQPEVEDRSAFSTTETAVKSFVANMQEAKKFPEHRVEGMEPVAAPKGVKGATLCAFASPDCKATCLVYSGQNQADMIANYAKFTKAAMFLEHPVAFMRLLVEAIRRFATHSDKKEKKDGSGLGRAGKVARFVRLNVFQDIPWEVIAPWIFDVTNDFPSALRVGFYEYTKVPGRPHHPNYHLSFSYSGENMEHCQQELVNERRNIVVVFGALGYMSGTQTSRLKFKDPKDKDKAFIKVNPLPKWFQDEQFLGGRPVPVLDGDVSDIRPFDKPGHIVGLRWKPPMLGGFDRAHTKQYYNAFVVKGRVVGTADPSDWQGRQYVIYGNSPMSQPITRPNVASDVARMDEWQEWSQ